MLIHLIQAIVVNLLRATGYAIRSKGRSIPVSMLLVFFEILSLPLSIFFDLWGKLGLRISLSKIFISMRYIKKSNQEPKYRRAISWAEAREFQSQIMSFFYKASQELRAKDWDSFISGCANFLHDVELLEEEKEAHLEMTKHLMESIGWTALFGQLHLQEKNKGTVYFYLMTWTQLAALPLTILFDYLASQAHQFGAGIIVNDVPRIPFLRNLGKLDQTISR